MARCQGAIAIDGSIDTREVEVAAERFIELLDVERDEKPTVRRECVVAGIPFGGQGKIGELDIIRDEEPDTVTSVLA